MAQSMTSIVIANSNLNAHSFFLTACTTYKITNAIDDLKNKKLPGQLKLIQNLLNSVNCMIYSKVI